MTQPDPVLRNAIKQYLTEIPAEDRASLIAEIGEQQPDPKPKPTEGLARGREKYNATKGNRIEVEGPQHHQTGAWS